MSEVLADSQLILPHRQLLVEYFWAIEAKQLGREYCCLAVGPGTVDTITIY